MGSKESFSSGTGGVVVGEVRWRGEGACTSVGRKDDIIAANVSVPSFWHKVPDPERCLGISQPSSLHSNDMRNGHDLGNLNPDPPILEVDVKCLTQKCSRLERKNGGHTKRSGIIQMEISKSKLGDEANGTSPKLVTSSPASCNNSEKNQIIKQNNSSSSRRGDKRTSRLKQKSRCEPFSLKNGLVGFSSAAGGNNFLGTYGLKTDVFDITKLVNELPLHDLVSGNYKSPSISKDKGKKSSSSNNDLMQSFRKACYVLQAQKGLQVQNCAEIENSCIRSDSTSLITVNSTVGQSGVDKGDNCTPVLLSTDEAQESDEKIQKFRIADAPLYTPKDISERLALPLPKDLDLLLSDASKATSSKNNADPRVGRPGAQRTGLPPFPWSQSFTGHARLGSDAMKLSAGRTTCQGKWVKVKNPIALQRSSADLLMDFESLAFDRSLVPSDNLVSEKQENILAPTERSFSVSGACSTSKVAADECSSIQVAAQTLIDMGAYSKENPCAVVKLLKRPSQVTMKASKTKLIKRCDFVDAPNSKVRPTNSLKASDGFPLKKLRLSKDALNACISHTEVGRQGKLHQSAAALPVRSPPRKLFRDSNTTTDSYGISVVKKSSILKTQRVVDRPSSTKPKFWKPSL
ncbi:uncharacterized protein LOC125221822 isoform X1 [Salvia hispanica]|uniref:uncharacterized protein LOC125221822 isoform X1 n=1 Tax=Salvia hispanica TaxID=49212 RepID=UPI0020093F30|nr:uncharacterized protein LOC125221822 isoform X1 [Salvia hispanica]